METKIDPPSGAPVVIPRSKQYDLTSKITGRTYRIFVAMPFGAKSGRKYPVMYLLDGNWYFGPAAYNATESGGAKEIAPVILVGIGFPTDDNNVISRRRGLELTPTAPGNRRSEYGGGDAFLRMIEEEVKPFIAANYPVDTAHQILYGKSFGGLAVLRQLFRNPSAYSVYIAASPAIAWDQKVVLADEPAFSARARSGELNLRILVLAAGNEQYRGPDPARRAADRGRMIDNAMELADRLALLNPGHVQVEKAIIADENHVSVSLADLGRALTFALPTGAGRGQ